MKHSDATLTDAIGDVPYRLALAGGWIDQPFVSRANPSPPGSMVVVGVRPTMPFIERAGIATGTRKQARALWGNKLPDGDPARLVRELYAAENAGKDEPSGSQDMIGLVYPGVNRLDYDAELEGGIFPCHIESHCDPETCAWLEQVVNVIAVAPRPPGYNPLEEKSIDPAWVERLGRSGRDCYDAILAHDVGSLGAAANECMRAWGALLPGTVRHRTITLDLLGILAHYQSRYPGAMYSGCGGGYLFVFSEDPVPGAFHVDVRI
ncbi:MAG: hypothetical protein KF847_09060 [Pirellulales bacterium]|nr:hypothetical protein [Pirellulales bacterium]